MLHEAMALVLRKEEKFSRLRKLVFQDGDETLRNICFERGIEFIGYDGERWI